MPNWQPSIEILRSHLANQVRCQTGGLCKLTLYMRSGNGASYWLWWLVGLNQELSLTKADADLCGLSFEGFRKDKYQLALDVKYEKGHVAIDSCTEQEAADIIGTKVLMKVFQGDVVLRDWWPLRIRSPIPGVTVLLKEATAALRQAALAPIETKQDVPRKSTGDIDRDRLLEALATGRFYVRSQTVISK